MERGMVFVLALCYTNVILVKSEIVITEVGMNSKVAAMSRNMRHVKYL